MLLGNNIREDYIGKFCQPGQENIKVSLSKVFFAFLKDRGFRAVALYRMGRHFRKGGHIISAKLMERLIHRLCFCEISTTADIGPGFRVFHPFGIVVGTDVKAGAGLTLSMDVVLGGNIGKHRADGGEKPILGNNINIAAGCKVVGPINISDNCLIGANSVVVSDIPSDCIVAGAPARIIKRNGQKVSLLEQEGEISEILRDLISRVEKLEDK